jgi:hypothetical protein
MSLRQRLGQGAQRLRGIAGFPVNRANGVRQRLGGGGVAGALGIFILGCSFVFPLLFLGSLALSLTDLGHFQERRGELMFVSGVLTLTSWTLLSLWKVPQWQAQHAASGPGQLLKRELLDIENTARTTLIPVVSGLGLVVTLLFTWYQIRDTRLAADETLKITHQGQLAQRYAAAIDDLDEDSVVVRTGAIYGLESIAKEAPDFYVQPVLQILISYLQTSLATPVASGSQETATTSSQQADRDAAYRVIEALIKLPKSEGLSLNLSGLVLADLDLRGAHLEGATLIETSFRGADLTDAHLEGADLTGADLRAANLTRANLTAAILRGARARGPQPATLDQTCLKGADLTTAEISVAGAVTDDATILPEGRRAGSVDPPPSLLHGQDCL